MTDGQTVKLKEEDDVSFVACVPAVFALAPAL
jgi:hypothetical protein